MVARYIHVVCVVSLASYPGVWGRVILSRTQAFGGELYCLVPTQFPDTTFPVVAGKVTIEWMAGMKDVTQCLCSKARTAAGIFILLFCVGLIYYLTTSNPRERRLVRVGGTSVSVVPLPQLKNENGHGVTSRQLSSLKFKFDPYGNDTIVFIHIQKTGGSQFLGHLQTVKKDGVSLCVASTNNPKSGQLRKKVHARCPRNWDFPSDDPWLVAEKTVGWFCGVHAFYTEFRSCLHNTSSRVLTRQVDPRRNFKYITFLRHPVLRYVSEYLHVQRGASWSNRHECGGRPVSDREMPPCYPGYYEREEWGNVSLQEYLSCQSNWANNRQTLMVADLETVGCFRQFLHPPEVRQRLILESAKRNLESFPYFGITEYMEESVLLFERTFEVEFGEKMGQRPFSSLHSAPMLQSLWSSQNVYDRIADTNALDMELYGYALQLFAARLESIGVKIDFSKVEREIEFLSPGAVAHTAKRFTQLRYEIP